MKMIVTAPAKLNLGLDFLRVHPDKSIEWRMVMTSISLCDYLQIETTASHKIQVVSDTGYLPEDGRNLAYQAAKIFLNNQKINCGVRITIEKHIPVSAGLGGGSSDAAAVLRGLNKIFETGLSFQQLAQLGLLVDSDVPFCVYGATALVSGRGEVVQPLKKLPKMWFVLVKPSVSVSTPRILRQLGRTAVNHPNIDQLLQQIEAENYPNIVEAMGNSLEKITAAKYPQISVLKERLVQYGADGAQMSGSGPTVFGVCEHESRAKRINNSISGFCHEVYIAHCISPN